MVWMMRCSSGVHPLAGAETWTWEMVFKPDADGKAEQRIFHLQSMDPATGEDVPEERMLFEIRIRDGQWCLDSFATSGGQRLPLLNCEKRYPFGKWYRVTTVYDGKMLKNYVGDELQGEGEVNCSATAGAFVGGGEDESGGLLQGSDLLDAVYAVGAGSGGFFEDADCAVESTAVAIIWLR